MKKVLFLAIPAALFLTLVIAKFAHAWMVEASAVCYNSPGNDMTLASAASYASGLEDNLAKARAFVGGDGDKEEAGPSEGDVYAFYFQTGALGLPAKAYAYAEGKLPDGAVQSDKENASANLN